MKRFKLTITMNEAKYPGTPLSGNSAEEYADDVYRWLLLHVGETPPPPHLRVHSIERGAVEEGPR